MTIAMPSNEKELTVLVASGNRRAYAMLYSSYLDSLYQFIYFFTKSKEQSDEIVQEVFISIWENRKNLAEVVSFKNYLFRSAKNKVIDEVRKQQTKHRVLQEFKRNNEFETQISDNEIIYREYYRIVQQAIHKLPPKRKHIFQLNFEHGLSQEEIAQQLHISKSVVQKQLYKAIGFVRTYLAQQAGFVTTAIIFIGFLLFV